MQSPLQLSIPCKTGTRSLSPTTFRWKLSVTHLDKLKDANHSLFIQLFRRFGVSLYQQSTCLCDGCVGSSVAPAARELILQMLSVEEAELGGVERCSRVRDVGKRELRKATS